MGRLALLVGNRLLSDNRLDKWMAYLMQHTNDFELLSPTRFVENIDVLVIPPMNVFTGYEEVVSARVPILGEINIDLFGLDFFKTMLQKYIDSNTKIVAFGHAADMLWVALGGKLAQAPREESLIDFLIGDYETSPLAYVSPKLGGTKTFHCSDFFESPTFKLIERPSQVIPIAWKTSLSRGEYSNEIKQAALPPTFDEYKGEIVAFEHIGTKMYGIKSNPVDFFNKQGSAVYRRYGFRIGSPIANTVIKFLLNEPDQKGTEEIPVPVAV